MKRKQQQLNNTTFQFIDKTTNEYFLKYYFYRYFNLQAVRRSLYLLP